MRQCYMGKRKNSPGFRRGSEGYTLQPYDPRKMEYELPAVSQMAGCGTLYSYQIVALFGEEPFEKSKLANEAGAEPGDEKAGDEAANE